VLTQNPLKEDDDFELTYYIVDIKLKKDPPPKYSLYITISIGLPMLIITMCSFEGKKFLKWMKVKFASCRGESQIG